MTFVAVAVPAMANFTPPATFEDVNRTARNLYDVELATVTERPVTFASVVSLVLSNCVVTRLLPPGFSTRPVSVDVVATESDVPELMNPAVVERLPPETVRSPPDVSVILVV